MKRLIALVLALGLSASVSAQQSASTGPVSLTSATCPGSGCVALPISGYGVVGFQIAGTYSGTISFEGSIDGSNWVAMTVYPSNSSTGVTTTTSTGVWSGGVGGLQAVRARMSSYSSGTATVSLLSAIVSARVGSGGTGGSSVVGTDTDVCFYDGTAASCSDAGFTYNKTTDSPTVAGQYLASGGYSASAPQYSWTANPGTGWSQSNNAIFGSVNGNAAIAVASVGSQVGLTSTYHLGFAAGAADAGNIDTGFSRTSAGLLEVNSGTTGTFRDFQAREVIAAGDNAGIASTTALSNVTNTTLTNAYTVKGGQGATTPNTGWIKIYVGTVASWIPYWSNATP